MNNFGKEHSKKQKNIMFRKLRERYVKETQGSSQNRRIREA